MTLQIFPLDHEPILELGAVTMLDEATKTLVDQAWDQEQKGRARPLIDGKLFSFVAHMPPRMRGCIIPYRRFVAQNRNPELFPKLRVRPVAVSGLVMCEDGVVFGRRAGTLVDAGCWELAPSGSIDNPRAGARAQLLKELTEETGIPAAAVNDIAPLAVIDDEGAHTVDIGYTLFVQLSALDIRRYAQRASGEYDTLEVVPTDQLERFLAAHDVIEVSRALLKQARLI